MLYFSLGGALPDTQDAAEVTCVCVRVCPESAEESPARATGHGGFMESPGQR